MHNQNNLITTAGRKGKTAKPLKEKVARKAKKQRVSKISQEPGEDQVVDTSTTDRLFWLAFNMNCVNCLRENPSV